MADKDTEAKWVKTELPKRTQSQHSYDARSYISATSDPNNDERLLGNTSEEATRLGNFPGKDWEGERVSRGYVKDLYSTGSNATYSRGGGNGLSSWTVSRHHSTDVNRPSLGTFERAHESQTEAGDTQGSKAIEGDEEIIKGLGKMNLG
ncbi:hypothetical protein L486_07286 [Kwoniella mangroviensis CBS 10435]|uniref:Uncharacterized protein n=1 Tax=Kwoniella mangroviensis CBS 10435 TaxID=1331196 RepID=A0A1B9II66_9TREE|nr:hypothetical protein L486_07286 [Kwoniella mangroviensis CBS 10435]